MSPRLRRSRGSEAGAAFVELAIAVPVLIVLLAGVGDFARLFYWGIELSDAARAAAQYGSASLSNSADTAGMKSMGAAAAADISLTSSDISMSLSCVCSDGTGSTFSATSPSANNCAVAAATACPTSGTHRILMVTATATKTFSSIMRVPPLPSSLTLTRTATERVSQ
jgi:Flp pilus assembly protein TadG